MKKFRFKKMKIKSGSFNGFLRYIFSMSLSAAFLALILIALPLTEQVSSSVKYDLVNKKDLYWAKEYELELKVEETQYFDKDIERTKSIIQKRLRIAGVEESSISYEKEGETNIIRVFVQTSKSKYLVDPLVKSPYLVRIVTRKEDFDYADTEDVLAPYLEENYNQTAFTRKDFRNVHITKLKNSANEYSYFAIFKTWPWKTEWEQFLQEYGGLTVGISIDGFVSPIQIPADQSIFAASISATEKENADMIGILYNSGIIPLNYSTKSEKEIEPNIAQVDYIKLTQGILLAVVLIYAYLLLVEKTPNHILLKSGLATVLTVSAWIAYLKISETPVDIFLLAIHIVTIIALIRIITENTESRIIVTVLVALLASICSIFGGGYVRIFAYDLLTVMIIANIALSISIPYISNIRKSLKI